MGKKIEENKVCKCCKGPFFVVDDGKPGGYYGVWLKRDEQESLWDASWSHIASGLTEINAHAISGALNERTLFGNLNKHAKKLIFK